jgi:branched-chain amino acid transport system ATP-binding protein
VARRARTAEPTADTTEELSAVPSPRRPGAQDDTEVAATTPAPVPGEGSGGEPALLRLTGVRSGYGALPVLHGVDFGVPEGQTAVLFGLNGAGKTTTAMNICGALGTWDGRIEFDGQDVTRWSARRCVDAGIVMVPEGRRVFPELSVERNLQVGSWSQRKQGDWVAGQRERVLDYFPRLRERLPQLAGTLSGGEQQMLAIARGLMANPRLLIVDEASMGLAPVIVKDVFEIVRNINADGVTVLLIEQNVGALDVADIGLVMAQGRVVHQLDGEELTDRSVVSHLLMG